MNDSAERNFRILTEIWMKIRVNERKPSKGLTKVFEKSRNSSYRDSSFREFFLPKLLCYGQRGRRICSSFRNIRVFEYSSYRECTVYHKSFVSFYYIANAKKKNHLGSKTGQPRPHGHMSLLKKTGRGYEVVKQEISIKTPSFNLHNEVFKKSAVLSSLISLSNNDVILISY